ncbi:UNVERIFIED_CONTAM: hypothetical protein FKN15_070244 [Acipenser sinensis]
MGSNPRCLGDGSGSSSQMGGGLCRTTSVDKTQANLLYTFSFSQSIDTKDKRKKKAINFQEIGSKRADRLPGSPPVTTRGFGGARIPVDKKMMGKPQGIMRGSPRPGLKQGQREHITVEDCLYNFCAYVAWVTFRRKDLKGIQEEVGRLLRSDTFNPAIRCLYNFCAYVAWVTFRRKDLKGIQEEVGRLLRSDTFNPAIRCLYNFCAYVAWVTFRRKDLKGIQEEVGRLLRSDTFNPAIRVRQASEEQSKKKNTVKGKVCPPERRKRNPKRPAIKSIINQRSPVIVSLLPSPKEKSQYLFKPHRLDQDKTIDSCDIEALVDELSAALSSNFGIIGEPLSQYSMQTLVPCGAEPEDEEEDEQERKLTSKMSLGSRGLSSSQNDSQGNGKLINQQ